MENLKFHDLMSEDHTIYATVNKNPNKMNTNKICIEIFDENENIVYSTQTHPHAWESLVYLSHQVIKMNKRIEEDLKLLG